MKIHEPQVTYDNQYANSLPLDVQPVRMPAPQPQPSDVHPFTADEKRLKRNLMTFKVDAPPITNKSKSAEFMHPFSCKVMGPRGSGKTSFTVSYIQKVACFRFSKIFIVTASPNQPLYKSLKENKQIFFVNLKELERIVEDETDVLVVLDDMMKEARYNGTLEVLFTKGRHEMISIMSLEQDPFYSSHIERTQKCRLFRPNTNA